MFCLDDSGQSVKSKCGRSCRALSGTFNDRRKCILAASSVSLLQRRRLQQILGLLSKAHAATKIHVWARHVALPPWQFSQLTYECRSPRSSYPFGKS